MKEMGLNFERDLTQQNYEESPAIKTEQAHKDLYEATEEGKKMVRSNASTPLVCTFNICGVNSFAHTICKSNSSCSTSLIRLLNSGNVEAGSPSSLSIEHYTISKLRRWDTTEETNCLLSQAVCRHVPEPTCATNPEHKEETGGRDH